MDEENLSLRDALLRAAVVEFASYGFDGARVDRIAARAKANKQLIYHYFDDKRGIYREVIKYMMGSNAALRSSLSRGDDERLSLEEVYRQQTAMFRGDALQWYHLLGWEGLQGRGEPIVAHDIRRREFDATSQALRQSQAAGKVDESLDPEMLIIFLMGLLMVPHLLPQLVTLATGLAIDDPMFERRYGEFVEEVLRRVGRPYDNNRA